MQTEKEKIEAAKRSLLSETKPLAYAKIIKLKEKQERGELTSRIDFAYDYACNLKCKHCMANNFEKKERRLTLADVRSISEQADAMGFCQFNISGGEPLISKDFDAVVEALQPEKFHIGISTNGHFLTPERAQKLRAQGIDKVMISVDSIDEAEMDDMRGKPGSYMKALDALKAAKAAGLQCVMQSVVTHQNCQSENTRRLAQYAKENGFDVDIIVAKALGAWEGNHDVLINGSDAKYLRELNEEFPHVRRDVFPSYGLKRGCGAINHCFHISMYGDVFPCVFMHISIGNVLDEPLEDILKRGMNVRWYNDYSPVCLAGEHRAFIDKYMSRFYNKPLPVDYREIFLEDSDYIDPSNK